MQPILDWSANLARAQQEKKEEEKKAARLAAAAAAAIEKAEEKGEARYRITPHPRLPYPTSTQ